MIKAVFFDLDETLIDAMECHLEANARAFDLFGLSYSEIDKKTEDKDYLGKRMNEILEDMRNSVGIREEKLPIKKLASTREKIFLELVIEKARLYPGAEQAIKNAKGKRAIIAIVSSGTHRYIQSALKKFQLAKYVDFIVGEEDVQRGKPYPDVYNKAFSLLPKNKKITKTECLVVEDAKNGVKAAKAAGLKVLFVPARFTSKNEIDFDWEIKTLKEFDLSKYS